MSETAPLLRFADLESQSAFKSYTNQEVERGRRPARSITFISNRDPLSVFSEVDRDEYSVVVNDREGFSHIELTRTIERQQYESGKRYIDGDFYLISHEEPSVYTAIAISEKEFFELGLLRFIESTPAYLTRSYLSTEDLRALFDSLDSRLNGNFIVTKAVVKSPSKETEITYRDSPYFEVFNEIRGDDFFIDKIQFELRDGRHEFEGFVSRIGGARFISGDGEVFFNFLISGIGKLLSSKDDLFSEKSREYGSRSSESIHIEYEEGAIIGVEENLRLVDALKGLKNSSLTVYHDNPYLHASVLDFVDGSTVDIFLTSDDEIALIPGFRASTRTLSKVCEQITESFREGEVVEEPEEDDQGLNEYFG